MREWSYADRQTGLTGDDVTEDGQLVYSTSSDEPWCPDHGYGCEPSNCPCGHTLHCDCWSIANEH